MAKLSFFKILKSNKGQSAVEYILLLALIASITFAVTKNRNFQAFIKGDSGLFSTMRKGMSYTYRYGREYIEGSEAEAAMSFEYDSPNHELYLNKKENQSRFIMGITTYGE
jgi:Flp pilus assembly pilin Flp